MNVAETLKQLGLNKKQSAELYKEYKKLKETEDKLKQDLMIQLKEDGLKSVKGEEYTASISETPTVVITHEPSVMEWLRNNPEVEEDFYIGVKGREFGTLTKQLLKDTGEIPNGTEVEVRESLQIRSNKKG